MWRLRRPPDPDPGGGSVPVQPPLEPSNIGEICARDTRSEYLFFPDNRLRRGVYFRREPSWEDPEREGEKPPLSGEPRGCKCIDDNVAYALPASCWKKNCSITPGVKYTRAAINFSPQKMEILILFSPMTAQRKKKDARTSNPFLGSRRYFHLGKCV